MLFQKPTAQRKQVWYLLAAPALAFVAIGALLFNPNMANALQKQQATPIIQTADIAIAKDAGVEGPAQEGRKTLQGKVSSELPKLTQKDTNDVFTSVEISPEPVGGLTAFRKWVSDNYKYPQAAIDAELKGQILVSYIVEKDGSLTNIKIVKDLGHGSGEALVDVLKKAKPWKAGIQNGKKVRVSFQLPMTLNIGEQG